MENIDYYKILGADKNSFHEEIKKKYRELAKELHTDRYQELPQEAKKHWRTG